MAFTSWMGEHSTQRTRDLSRSHQLKNRSTIYTTSTCTTCTTSTPSTTTPHACSREAARPGALPSAHRRCNANRVRPFTIITIPVISRATPAPSTTAPAVRVSPLVMPTSSPPVNVPA